MQRDHTEYTVATIGLSIQEAILVQALVELVPAGVGRKWRYSKSPPAAVVIVDIQSREGTRYLQAQPPAGVVTLGDGPAPDSRLPHLERPIRNQNLRELLSRMAGGAQHPTAPPSAVAPAPATAAPESALSRLEKLKQRLSNRPPQTPRPAAQDPALSAAPAPPASVPPAAENGIHLLLSGLARGTIQHRLHFLPTRGPEFAADPDTDSGFVMGGLKALLALPGDGGLGRVNVERMNGRELASFETRAERCPLDRLRWQLGMGFSGGMLMGELTEWPAFRLKRWPDFGQLPYRRELARAARRLMTHASTPQQLARKGGLEPGQVAAFLNAAYLCGWLVREKEAAPDPDQPTRNPARTKLIGKLRASLGI